MKGKHKRQASRDKNGQRVTKTYRELHTAPGPQCYCSAANTSDSYNDVGHNVGDGDGSLASVLKAWGKVVVLNCFY